MNLPTLTAVFPSSSEALLLLPPPTLLVILIRLVVLGGLIIALRGRGGPAEGDSGGELAMAQLNLSLRPKCSYCSSVVLWWGLDCQIVNRFGAVLTGRRIKVYKAAVMSQSRSSESVSTDAKVSGSPFPKDSLVNLWWPGANASLAMMQAL